MLDQKLVHKSQLLLLYLCSENDLWMTVCKKLAGISLARLQIMHHKAKNTVASLVLLMDLKV